MKIEYFLSSSVCVVIPLIALWYYVRLVKKMKAEMVESPPVFSLFLVLMSYTIIPIVTAFPIIDRLIPINELLMYYSYIVAPVVMFFVAAVNHGKRYFSKFHLWVYRTSLIYLLVAPVSLFIWLYLIFHIGLK